MIDDSPTCSFQLSPFPLEWDQIRLLNKTAPPLVRRFPRFFLRGHKSNILGFILFIRTTCRRRAVTCELQSNNYKHFGIQIILGGLQRFVFNKLVSCIDTYIVMFIIGTSDAHDRRLCQSPIFSGGREYKWPDCSGPRPGDRNYVSRGDGYVVTGNDIS